MPGRGPLCGQSVRCAVENYPDLRVKFGILQAGQEVVLWAGMAYCEVVIEQWYKPNGINIKKTEVMKVTTYLDIY